MREAARRVTLATGAFAAAGVPMFVVGQSPAGADDRVVTDPVTGATLTITNEGNCELLDVVESGGQSSTTENQTQNLAYHINNDCTVTLDSGYWGAPPVDDDPESSAGIESGTGVGDDPESYHFNWIITTQTLQDIINIDIAKFKFHARRSWNGDLTRFTGHWVARSSTSVSWNHTSGNPSLNYLETTLATSRKAKANGNFHSDFLWCNFEPGQNFNMNTKITTSKNGDYGREYAQNRQCAGTHKATNSHTQSNAPGEWCDLYPGQLDC